MLKPISVNNNVQTWLLIGWQLSCQPIRSSVRKSLLKCFLIWIILSIPGSWYISLCSSPLLNLIIFSYPDLAYNEYILIVVTCLAMLLVVILLFCICCKGNKDENGDVYKVTSSPTPQVGASTDRRFTVSDYDYEEEKWDRTINRQLNLSSH